MKGFNRLLVRLSRVVLIISFLGCLACQQGRWRKEKVQSQYHLIDTLVPIDSAIHKQLIPYQDSLAQAMNRVIGVAGRELYGGFPEGLLSNFVSDLILDECRLVADNPLKPDVCIINIKGLRAPIQQGDITIGDIYQLMPFENEIVYLTLSKDQMLELFHFMAGVNGDGMAGASFGIKNKSAVNIQVDQRPLEDREYLVATSDYLADGGDHFDVFKTAISRKRSGIKVRDVIIQHIQRLTAHQKSVNSHLDKRIYHVK